MTQSRTGRPVLNPQKGPRPRTNEERFWEKVEKTDGCWPFAGAKVYYNHRNGHRYGGYGVFGVRTPGLRGHRQRLAHRFAWELAHGPVPRGLDVLHRCDNPPCVKTEPDEQWPQGHLFLGTAQDNGRDMTEKGRSGLAKLTDEIVRAIRSSAAPSKALADTYGVHYSTVNNIRRGKTWKHAEAWPTEQGDDE